MFLSRRKLLASLGLALPAAAVVATEADAATRKKKLVKHPVHVVHKKPVHHVVHHPLKKKVAPKG